MVTLCHYARQRPSPFSPRPNDPPLPPSIPFNLQATLARTPICHLRLRRRALAKEASQACLCLWSPRSLPLPGIVLPTIGPSRSATPDRCASVSRKRRQARVTRLPELCG